MNITLECILTNATTALTYISYYEKLVFSAGIIDCAPSVYKSEWRVNRNVLSIKTFQVLGITVCNILSLLTSKGVPVAEFEIFSTGLKTVN